MAKTKYWNSIKILLKLGFTTFLGWLVFQKIDFQQVKSIFMKSDPFYIIAAWLSYFVSQAISSWRLLGFLNSIGLQIHFGFNFRLYLLGMFYNVFLPGGIGGDGYKIYILRKKFQLPVKKIFLCILLDRVSGLWAICLLAAVLVLFIPYFQNIEWWPSIIIIIATLIYFLLYRRYFFTYIQNFIAAHGKAILIQALQLLSIFFILSAQDFKEPIFPYMFCFLLSSLATIIPVSIGGLGMREYVMVVASPLLGMNETLAVFTTLCFYILSTLTALPGIWFVYRSKEFEHFHGEKQERVLKDNPEEIIHSHMNIP